LFKAARGLKGDSNINNDNNRSFHKNENTGKKMQALFQGEILAKLNAFEMEKAYTDSIG